MNLIGDGELKHFGYASGNYMVRCGQCNHMQFGLDKRALTCRPCAVELYNKEVEEREFYNIFPN